nr:MAG TPA: hypothetical protein [Caudoviricetes sp.]
MTIFLPVFQGFCTQIAKSISTLSRQHFKMLSF